MKINALVAHDANALLASAPITLRSVQHQDVKIEVLYCGVCHSDLHMARNEWAVSRYPLVPGHEIVGKVVEVGAGVTRFSTGTLSVGRYPRNVAPFAADHPDGISTPKY